jgi:hypothetical protein
MRTHATFRGVQRLRQGCETDFGRSEGRDIETRRCVQETGEREPAQTWAEAKDQAIFRFPRPRLALFQLRRFAADEFSIRETFAGDLRDGQIEALAISEFLPVRVLALIEAERLFIDVSLKVRGINADVGPLQRPLEQRPKIFQTVRVNPPVNVPFEMVNKFAFEISADVSVDRKIIRVEFRSGFDMLLKKWLDMMLHSAWSDGGADVAITFQQAENNRLVPVRSGRLGASIPCRFAVHVGNLPTDESFVGFNFGFELVGTFVFHREPDAVQHVPRAFLTDSERTVNLPRRNSVLHAGLHPDRSEPLVQAKRGVFHDGSNLRGELRFGMPRLALPQATGRNVRHVLSSAHGARNTVRPTPRDDVRDAVIQIRKIEDRLLQSLGFFSHEPILRQVS